MRRLLVSGLFLIASAAALAAPAVDNSPVLGSGKPR